MLEINQILNNRLGVFKTLSKVNIDLQFYVF